MVRTKSQKHAPPTPALQRCPESSPRHTSRTTRSLKTSRRYLGVNCRCRLAQTHGMVSPN
ncbi:MAG: hypothetical protein ACOC6G_02420 [Thermoproteota archaeon]